MDGEGDDGLSGDESAAGKDEVGGAGDEDEPRGKGGGEGDAEGDDRGDDGEGGEDGDASEAVGESTDEGCGEGAGGAAEEIDEGQLAFGETEVADHVGGEEGNDGEMAEDEE